MKSKLTTKMHQLMVMISSFGLLLLLCACQIDSQVSKKVDDSPWLIQDEIEREKPTGPEKTQGSDEPLNASAESKFQTRKENEKHNQADEALGDTKDELDITKESEQAATNSESVSSQTLEADKTEQKQLVDINQTIENSENKLSYLQSLPKRSIVQMKRLTMVEQELRRIVNEERDKVALNAYFDNPTLTLFLEKQLVYNLHYLLAAKLTNGPDNALFLAYNSEKQVSDIVLSNYFAKQLIENEANRIFLLGDSYDQLALLLMYCERTGDEPTHHYLMAAMPFRSNWSAELELIQPKPEVNGHSLPQASKLNKAEQDNKADNKSSELTSTEKKPSDKLNEAEEAPLTAEAEVKE